MSGVGLDPEPTRFWGSLKADLVSVFKPKIAYFAAHRAEGKLERLTPHRSP